MDKTPLLPSWAQSPEADESPPDDSAPNESAETPDEDVMGDGEAFLDNTTGIENVEHTPHGPVPSDYGSWRAAKRNLGSAVRSGGQHNAYRSAGRSYVRAHGGAAQAARTAAAGRTASTQFGQFFAYVATHGIGAALASTGLSSAIGQGAEAVLAAIANVLAPDGATRESAIARDSITETLEFLYERFSLQDGDLSRLDAMTAGDIKLALGELIGNYIFNRWLAELGRMIEDKSVSATQAITFERDVREYIRTSIQLDLKDTDILTMDWAGVAGQSFIESAFSEAYSLLEGT